MSDGRVDIAAVRTKLAGLAGRQYWQGLEALAETDEFMEYLHREFPRQAAVWDESAADGSSVGMSRRSFFKLLGASLALAGLAGCVNVPARKIVPYVKSPDTNQIPGKSLYYTTAMTHAGYAMGLLVESNEGRPTKIEGNPDHPASLGSTDTFAQAAVLGLYDPARSTAVLHDGTDRHDTPTSPRHLRPRSRPPARNGGSGIRIVTEVTSSPTLIAQMESILAGAAERALAAVGAGRERPGGRWARGWPLAATSTPSTASTGPTRSSASTPTSSRAMPTRCATRAISSTGGGSRARRGNSMNRLYAVEGTPTLTGAKADHRLRVLSRDVLTVAQAVAERVSGCRASRPRQRCPQGVPAGVRRRAGARPAGAHAGRASSSRAATSAPVVHALAHAMNAALGNAGKTVLYTEPVVARPGDLTAALRDARDGHERGRGAAAADSRRQPGLHRAGRPGLCGCAEEGRDAHPPGAVRGRDRDGRATGTCRRRISSRRGATRGRSTAPRASCSR